MVSQARAMQLQNPKIDQMIFIGKDKIMSWPQIESYVIYCSRELPRGLQSIFVDASQLTVDLNNGQTYLWLRKPNECSFFYCRIFLWHLTLVGTQVCIITIENIFYDTTENDNKHEDSDSIGSIIDINLAKSTI